MSERENGSPEPEKIDKYRSWRFGFPRMLHELKERYGDRAIDHYAETLLAEINIKAEYEFNPEDRKKLLTEPGLVIGNHPGNLDTSLVLKAMTDEYGQVRRDLKIFTGEEGAGLLQNNLGENYFIPGTGLGLATAINHIKQGGAILFFPSGGKKIAGREYEFKNGVATIINRLSPKHMVYTFSINADECFKVEWGLQSIEKAFANPNLNLARDPEIVHVREKYTQASYWQNHLVRNNTQINLPDSAMSLTNAFLEMYPESKKGTQ